MHRGYSTPTPQQAGHGRARHRRRDAARVPPRVDRAPSPRSPRGCAPWHPGTPIGQPVRSGDRGDGRKRPVPTSHPQRVRSAFHGRAYQPHQALAGGQDDRLDPPVPRPLGDPGPGRRAITRPRVDKQHRPSWRVNGPPAKLRQLMLCQRRPPPVAEPWTAPPMPPPGQPGSSRYAPSARGGPGAGSV